MFIELLKGVRTVGKRLAPLAAALGLVLGGAVLRAAGSVASLGLTVPLSTAGLAVPMDVPWGVAPEPGGNLLVSDPNNNRIIRIPRRGNASVLSISGLGTPLNQPRGLALDGSGNLFIADMGNHRIVRVAPDGGASVVDTSALVTSTGVGLNGPLSVAVDRSGNLYIVDTGNERMVKVPAGGAAAVFAITGQAVTNPCAVSLDSFGTLYIADWGGNRIVKATADGAGTLLATPALQSPRAVAVSAAGTVFIADAGNQRIVKVDSQGTGSVVPLGTGTLPSPVGLALGPQEQLLVVEAAGKHVLEVMNGAVDFGVLSLGSGQATRTLTIQVGPTATLTSLAASTQGSPCWDFCVTGGTAASGVRNASATVELTFSPAGPGLRRGHLVVHFEDGGVQGAFTVPLFGFADAPMVSLDPAVASVVSLGGAPLASPVSAVQACDGTIYVSSYLNARVYRILPGGAVSQVDWGAYTVGFNGWGVAGLALDGGGNLFLADYLNSRILVRTPDGRAMALTLAGLPTGLANPLSLCLDAAGDLVVTDYTGGRIIRVDAPGLLEAINAGVADSDTSPIPAAVLATAGFTFAPTDLAGITMDPDGNLWIADRLSSPGRIVKVSPGGTGSVLPLPGISGLANPQGIASDAFGNLYIADSDNQRLLQVTPAGAPRVVTLAGAALGGSIYGVTPCPDGSVLVCDWSNNRLLRVQPGASALGFPTTAVGSTSAARTVAVTNLGSQDLLFSAAPTYTADFIQPDGAVDPVTASTRLAPGDSAGLAVAFSPQGSGSRSANIVLTDNTLNAGGSTQQVAVTGTGIVNPPTVQASGLSVPAASPTQLTASWIRGDGARCAAFVAATDSGQPSLPSGRTFLAGTILGAGSPDGTGWSCVYNGTGTSVTVTGLSQGTTYRIVVVEYNGPSGSEVYLATAGSGNAINQVAPAPAYPVTFATDGTAGATLQGSATQQVTSGGSATAVTAVAPDGYVFVNWTGTNGFPTTSANPVTVTGVTGPCDLTAHFAAAAIVIPVAPASPGPILAGSGATTSLTLATVGRVVGPVALSASGLPEGATCTFSRNPVDLSQGPQTVDVRIATAPWPAPAARNRGRLPLEGLGAGALLACGVFALPGGRRRRLGVHLAILAVAAAAGLTGCGGHPASGGSTGGAKGTPAGSYQVTLTATAQGGAQASTTFLLTVQGGADRGL